MKSGQKEALSSNCSLLDCVCVCVYTFVDVSVCSCAVGGIKQLDLISLLQLYDVICMRICTGALEKRQVGFCSPLPSEGCSADAITV